MVRRRGIAAAKAGTLGLLEPRIEPKELAALVLIVDDYDDSRAVYAEYMLFCGFRVAEARDGQEAVEKALALDPDVIVMDMHLPGLDGWHATEKLKQTSSTCDIAVIAFSADASDDTRRRAEDAGCCRFLEKPCAPDALLGAVRRALPRARPPVSSRDFSHVRIVKGSHPLAVKRRAAHGDDATKGQRGDRREDESTLLTMIPSTTAPKR